MMLLKFLNLPALKQPRRLFAIDFSCALSAGAIYFLLFDLMVEVLALPVWVAQTQLAANFLYGLYGAALFLKRDASEGFFRFLIAMNGLYAIFCIVVSLILFLQAIYGAALLLLVEGTFVAILARLEQKSIG